MLLKMAASVYASIMLGIWLAITAALIWSGLALSQDTWGNWVSLLIGWAMHSLWYWFLIGYDAADILLRVLRGQRPGYMWSIRQGIV